MASRSHGGDCQDTLEFCSRVAHELRTPLMLLRLRLDDAPPGMPPEFLKELQDELARLSRFVERSLLAMKAEQGALKPVTKDCDLGAIVREVSEKHQLLATGRELEMTLEIDPGARINADSDLLRQALHGLLENAVRYAGSRLRVTCRGGATAVVEIDNDRDPDTVAPGGLGLGLQLVKGICKACDWQFASRPADCSYHASIRFT